VSSRRTELDVSSQSRISTCSVVSLRWYSRSEVFEGHELGGNERAQLTDCRLRLRTFTRALTTPCQMVTPCQGYGGAISVSPGGPSAALALGHLTTAVRTSLPQQFTTAYAKYVFYSRYLPLLPVCCQQCTRTRTASADDHICTNCESHQRHMMAARRHESCRITLPTRNIRAAPRGWSPAFDHRVLGNNQGTWWPSR
jgi:hypothetical protein